jgi:hypothetical protein
VCSREVHQDAVVDPEPALLTDGRNHQSRRPSAGKRRHDLGEVRREHAVVGHVGPSLLRLCLHARYFIYLYMSWNHKTRKRGNWMATRIQIYPIEDQPGFHVFYRLPTLDFF